MLTRAQLYQRLDDLIAEGEAPTWMTAESLSTLMNGYLIDDETPRTMYRRVAKAATSYAGKEYEEPFFDIMWKNWLCPASPILSNLGTTRGFPISCNSISIHDSVTDIFETLTEMAMLSKHGAGLGVYIGDVRGRNAKIKGNGVSEGVIPWMKVYDAATIAVSQGQVRRGSTAMYLPIEHVDAEDFLRVRRPVGDVNRQCLNIHHAFTITDAFMGRAAAGEPQARKMWSELLRTRVETSEPYMAFIDTINRANPPMYKPNGLSVKTSNLCCLAGDTLVTTRNGPKRIDSLVDKTVEIWDGLRWVENSSFELKGQDDLYRVHLNNGSYIDCNSRHRWFVAKKYWNIQSKKYRERTTDQLQEGTWLEAHSTQSHGSTYSPGAYLKGFLCGDGTHTNDRPLLMLHSPKYMCMEALISSCSEIEVERVKTNAIATPGFGIEHRYENTEAYGNVITRTMKGLSVRKDALIPWVTSARRELPEEVWTWTRESKIRFLSGLIDSDGCLSSGMIQISSVHESFIWSVYYLIRTLGFTGNVDTMNDCHRISIPVAHSHELISEGYTKRVTKSKKANRICTNWRRIVKIERLEGKHPVYCPTVPSTGKFALANGLMTGNSEITLHTDPSHSFVCCLSSLNVARWHEWKNSNVVQLTTRFLDAVQSAYIYQATGEKWLEAAVRSAVKSRAIGIGVLGWHSLLQQEGLPFDSFDSMGINARIFRHIHDESLIASRALAVEFGEPEWCQGFGVRNTHRLAVAPTMSNSTIAGGYSAGIEPVAANIYNFKGYDGTWIRKNPQLVRVLASRGHDTPEVWRSMIEFDGSVQHLDDAILSKDEKAIFATAREINQHAVVKQAAQRQAWIDQSQSLNLFFAQNASPQYIHDVHFAAWREGVKSLYYLRSEGVLKGDLASRSKNECAACEG